VTASAAREQPIVFAMTSVTFVTRVLVKSCRASMSKLIVPRRVEG
jgi:hypothetical protein